MEETDSKWREAWIGAEYEGVLELDGDKLIITCEEVLAIHGDQAEILDDGRTVGIADGDRVAFGVVPRDGDSPIAVNVFRLGRQKKRKVEAQEKLKAKNKEPEVPDTLQGELTGVVKHQSERSGNLFIECKKAYETYQRDVKIFYDSIPDGITVGVPILFELIPPRDEWDQPVAKNISKAEGAVADAIRSSSFFLRRSRKGKGKGVEITKALMRMVGVVKKKSMNTRRHFVSCADISEVYGRDAQIPPSEMIEDLAPGDHIEFDVEEPGEGSSACPLARNIKKITKPTKQLAAGDGEEEADDAVEPIEEDDGEVEEDQQKREVEQLINADEGYDQAEGDLADEFDTGHPGFDAEEDEAPMEEPETKEGWIKHQKAFFGNLPPLPTGWIRIRSKSSGNVYYYNVDTGQSTPNAPPGTLGSGGKISIKRKWAG